MSKETLSKRDGRLLKSICHLSGVIEAWDTQHLPFVLDNLSKECAEGDVHNRANTGLKAELEEARESQPIRNYCKALHIQLGECKKDQM